MNPRTKAILKVSVVAGLLVGAATWAMSRIHYVTGAGEEGLQVWFYDQSEGRLYAVPRDTIPPHKGIGGTEDDGVKAVVVAPLADCNDSKKRRIAYLETYTPDYKRLLEDVRAAQAAGRPLGRPMPDPETGYYEKNTLVRRVDDPKWYDLTTAEAKRIVAEGRSRRGPNGEAQGICTP